MDNKIQELILEKLFSHVDDQYPGWKSVAVNLLEKGETAVADGSFNGCMWKGGVGNFITVDVHPKYEGCYYYKFDKESFYKSSIFAEVLYQKRGSLDEEKLSLLKKIDDIDKEIEEIKSITDLIHDV